MMHQMPHTAPVLQRIGQWLNHIPQPILLLALLSLAFLYRLGSQALFDLDEGAFSAATVEMLQRHDFITTYLNGEPRFDKPILIYWLQAISVSLLGVNEWALRLPSALAAAAWMWALLRFARRHVNPASAFPTAVIGATAFFVTIIGRAAIADAMLNLCLTLAMLAIYQYSAQPHRKTIYTAFFWIGLGVLTKGPIAIIIPLCVSFIYFAWSRELKTWLGALLQPGAWIIFIVIVAPWYLLEYRDQGQAFIDGFILKHNVGRFTATMEGHGGNVLYYLPVLLFIVMPYTGLLITIISRIKTTFTNRLDRFLWLWFGFVFIFFSFSNTQLPHYLLYGVPPLILLMSKHREQLHSRVLAYLPAILFFTLLVFLPEVLQLAVQGNENLFVQAMRTQAVHAMDMQYRLWPALALLLSLVFLMMSRQQLRPWQGLTILGVLQIVVIMQAVLPAVATFQQEPIKQVALHARQFDEPVVMWRVSLPSFSVYRQAITPDRDPKPGELVFTQIDKLSALGPYTPIFQQAGIVLVRKLPAVTVQK